MLMRWLSLHAHSSSHTAVRAIDTAVCCMRTRFADSHHIPESLAKRGSPAALVLEAACLCCVNQLLRLLHGQDPRDHQHVVVHLLRPQLFVTDAEGWREVVLHVFVLPWAGAGDLCAWWSAVRKGGG